MSVLSLYIPIVSEKCSENYMKTVFVEKKIGKIMRVDFVENIIKKRREAFIHFDEWFDTDESNALKDDILNLDTKTKLYYTEKRFWPILVNKNAHKRINNPNYKILDNDKIKNEFVKSLNIISSKQSNTDSKSQCSSKKTKN
jgi:hypothetical protein